MNEAGIPDVIAAKRVRLLLVQPGGRDQVTVASDRTDAIEFSAPSHGRV